MAKLIHGRLTFAIIGAAMEVHRRLGPGFLEAVYEHALAHELSLRGLKYETQRPLRVHYYKGADVGSYVADMIVGDSVLVELRAAAKSLAKEHHAQVINYLTATGVEIGLLLNVGRRSLEYERSIRSGSK